MAQKSGLFEERPHRIGNDAAFLAVDCASRHEYYVVPGVISGIIRRTLSRICRFTLLRWTLPPTFFETENPTLSAPFVFTVYKTKSSFEKTVPFL